MAPHEMMSKAGIYSVFPLSLTLGVDLLQGQQWVQTVIIGQSFMLHQTHFLSMTKHVDLLQGQQWVRTVIIGQSFMLHQTHLLPMTKRVDLLQGQ